jgi:hypothetical protein
VRNGHLGGMPPDDGLESAFSENYTDAQWQSIAEHLSEHVQNGLI